MRIKEEFETTLRIKELETTPNSRCVNVMEQVNINGDSSVTDIKFSAHNDPVASSGILSPPTTPSATTPVDNDYSPSTTGSGRFKFFKDGKFILELWHHRNGERMYWIPVSKSSTFWPPTVNCTSRQESSTSLSVSDDNLSIQSSPWQRDHIWKQNIPRKNVNKELTFSMFIPCGLRRKNCFALNCKRRKRRRPYDAIRMDELLRDFNRDSDDVHSVMKRMNSDSQISFNNNSSNNNNNNNNNTNKTKRSGTTLNEIAQTLWERKTPLESSVISCRTDAGIVSPRKRILREMEKVSLEEFGNVNKKHRTKVSSGNCSSPSIIVTASTVNASSFFSTATGGSSSSNNKQISSHSINSILAKDEEPPSVLRNLLRSPSTDNSYESSTSRSTYGNDSPSSSEIRSIIATTTASSSATSNTVLPGLADVVSRCSTPVTSSPLLLATIAQPVPAYQIPAASSYIYHPSPSYLSSPSISHHPYYSIFASSSGYPSPPATVWGCRSLSSLPNSTLYPSPSLPSYSALNMASWIPLAHSSFKSYPAATDNGTDVPLNLSKHQY